MAAETCERLLPAAFFMFTKVLGVMVTLSRCDKDDVELRWITAEMLASLILSTFSLNTGSVRLTVMSLIARCDNYDEED